MLYGSGGRVAGAEFGEGGGGGKSGKKEWILLMCDSLRLPGLELIYVPLVQVKVEYQSPSRTVK